MTRPTKYKEEYEQQVYMLALLGATDKQMCKYFEVEEKTFNNWKKAHPSFFQSLKKGKDFADAKVAESLFKKACGDDKNPPDTIACIFWLKNRQPQLWRDKQEITTTPDEEVKYAYLKAMRDLNVSNKMGKKSIQPESQSIS